MCSQDGTSIFHNEVRSLSRAKGFDEGTSTEWRKFNFLFEKEASLVIHFSDVSR
jgi:hypothetical protein